jgi:hypothetical protein
MVRLLHSHSKARDKKTWYPKSWPSRGRSFETREMETSELEAPHREPGITFISTMGFEDLDAEAIPGVTFIFILAGRERRNQFEIVKNCEKKNKARFKTAPVASNNVLR